MRMTRMIIMAGFFMFLAGFISMFFSMSEATGNLTLLGILIAITGGIMRLVKDASWLE